MLRIYRYARYEDHLDITGQDVLSLSGQPKEMAQSLLPMLRQTSAMSKRLGVARVLRTGSGEVADEIHEFDNVRQGKFKLNRLLVREGRVIEIDYQW